MSLFFTSKWQRMLQQMGYLVDQKGIYRRYSLEMQHWQTHINKCCEFITSNALENGNHSVAVLGSGWLIDLPVDFICSNFKKVYLFDVHHPVAIRHRLRKYKNIVFVEHDISGGAIEETFNAVKTYKNKKKKIEPEEYQINGFQYPESFDCVISLNILNQLDILSMDYLRKHTIYNSKEIAYLSQHIQQQHINSLPKGKSLLITDYEEVWVSNNGLQMGSKSLIHIPLPNNNAMNRWQWFFDTHHNYYADRNIIFNVIALKM